MSNSHVQSAKAIAEDIAHLCCVPDDWRLQISDLAAWPFPTSWAKPSGGEYGPRTDERRLVMKKSIVAILALVVVSAYGQTPEMQVINGAAEALGGKNRIP